MPAVTSPPATISTGGGSYSSNSQHKRFSTVTALRSGGGGSTATPSSVAQRGSVKGLFDVAAGDAAVALTARTEEGPWSVSVAEARETTTVTTLKRRSHKATPPPTMSAYTIYMTTPTHNLTLVRTVAELLELDAKLREGPSSSAKALPLLPSSLPSVPLSPLGSPQASGRRILQTISRTLSPGGNRKERAALANITPTESDTSSPKPTAVVTEGGAATTTLLGAYLTSLSNAPGVRRHKAWRRFVRVRSDDLESVRVERRVRKVRSDLAQHVKSSVAPTNINVGLTPDVAGGEDARTDDDSRSVSGRSTSHSYTRHTPRPEVPVRSTSALDADKLLNSANNGAKTPSVANIPEEHEREATPGASVAVLAPTDSNAPLPAKTDMEAASTAAPDESTNGDKTAVAKRERRHRRSTAAAADKVTVDDFDMIRVLGKGCAGKVLLVRHKPTKGLFAMKSIHKRHVLAHQELQHTLTEQAVLKRMASDVMDPFVVKLWWSFHDKNNLYLVMDFHPGGDLATQLSRWGRLGRDRARFYAAEIVEGVEGLHRAGVVYRDLKPENVLIGADGHIILSDFGLSKEFPVRDAKGGRGGSSTPPPGSPTRSQSSSQVNKTHQPHWLSASEDGSSAGAAASDSFSRSSRNRWADERDVTTTFCGTAEYLAPEVIQGAAYSYEVDWWSFGTMLYEMLTGITPFWADTHADMYVRVLHDELVFPDDRVLDQDTKSILRGLLQRNPMLRMKEPRIKKHPYFSMIEWPHVFHKRYIPPYIPPIDPHDETDTQNFDETFLDMQPVVHGAEAGEGEEADESSKDSALLNGNETEELEGSSQAEARRIAQLKLDSAADGKSLFDGYSFRGRRDSEAPSIIFSSDPSEAAEARGAGDPQLDDSAQPEPELELELESEDEQTAARDAVAALARLESEASADGSMSVTSQSTQPTSVAYSRERGANTSGDTDESGVVAVAASKSRTALAAGGLPAHDTIAETDDEDEDWDLVDVPSGQALQSELNGGKGANLFARGVVDTYRMLRRQESSRLPSSNSSSQRPFNRLSRRNPSSRRSLARPSNGNLTSASAASLVSSVAARSGVEGALSADEGTPDLERGEAGDALRTSALPTPTGEVTSQQRKNGASPSLASSSDDLNSQERRKQRMKKIKRFTTFFDVSR